MEVQDWKWFHYYWNLCKHFGRECYRTWRWELASSVLVGYFVAFLTGGWKDFRTAVLATGLTLGCFVIVHLMRLPWLLHKSIHGKDEKSSDPGVLSGIFGMFVIAAIFVGGYKFAVAVWSTHPIGEIIVGTADEGAKDAQITQLNRTVEGLEKQKTTPTTRVILNPQQAYLHYLTPELADFQIGTPISAKTTFVNSAPALATRAGCISRLTVEQKKPLGTHGEMMMPSEIEEPRWKDFLKFADPRLKNATGTFGSQENAANTWNTAFGPALDEPSNQLIAADKETLLVLGKCSWNDSTGRNSSDFCDWLQGRTQHNEFVWHSCAHYNGLELK